MGRHKISRLRRRRPPARRSQAVSLAKICALSFVVTLLVALNVPTGGTPDPGLQFITREGAQRTQARSTLAADAPLATEVPGDHVVARALPAAAALPGAPGAARLGGATGPYGLTGGTGGLTSTGIPARAHQAYVTAATKTAAADPSCRITWSVLAGIGRVESNHGRFGGAGLRADGVVQPAILGIRLDGTRAGTARISDSDGGRFDGDAAFDRAVGPMQFLPGTWNGYGADADGDGVANPQDIDDAALGAARYLCAGNATFATREGAWSAVYRYNHSDSYVRLVLSLADSYGSGRPVEFTDAPPGAARPGGEQASPPGTPPAVPAPVTPQPPAAAVTPTPTPSPTGTPTTPPTSTPPTGTPSPTGTPTPTAPPTSSKPPTGKPPIVVPPTTTPPTTTPPPTTPTPTPTDTPCATPTDTPTPTPTPAPGETCPTPSETTTPPGAESTPTPEATPTP